MIKEQIEQTLQCLVGLPLHDAGRAADLEWFSFGAPRTVAGRHGEPRTVGDYALHLQCAWRISGPSGIHVASRDRYYPATHIEVDLLEFDWDHPGANRCDERMNLFFAEHAGVPLIVRSVHADALGSLRITFDNAYVLEVFPDSSRGSEHWRFFQPAMDADHFVVTGAGIE